MKKDLIPYELAFILKKMGFNEDCFSYYDYWVDSNGKDRFTFRMGTANGDSITPVPTFSQAFRFFREKYRLVGLIEIGAQEYSYIIFDEVTDSRKFSGSMNGTYEEVELECLKKLIEIVKDNMI